MERAGGTYQSSFHQPPLPNPLPPGERGLTARRAGRASADNHAMHILFTLLAIAIGTGIGWLVAKKSWFTFSGNIVEINRANDLKALPKDAEAV